MKLYFKQRFFHGLIVMIFMMRQEVRFILLRGSWHGDTA